MTLASGVDVAAMRRILVIGCPGAGKSTLAHKLSDKMGLPIVHLDRLWWQPGWIETTKAVFDEALSFAIRDPEWIIDGNYIRTLPMRLSEADLVIWLDYGRIGCIARALWRRIQYNGRTRTDITSGCPERIDLEFLAYIWSFRSKVRPRIMAALEAHGAGTCVVRLFSPREAKMFLSSLC